MSAAASQKNTPDRCLATAAGEPGAQVDAVLELKEASHPIGIHIVGDGGTAELDRMLEHLAKGKPEPLQIGFGEPSCDAPRADAGVKQALVGVNIAYPGEQRLIEQRSFDGQPAGAKESREWCGLDGQRIQALGCERVAPREIAELKTAKTARIHEAQFLTAGQREAGVGVGDNRCVGSGDQQTAGHAKVHNPLRVRLRRGLFIGASRCGGRRTELADNMFSGAMNREQQAAIQTLGLTGRRCFEGFFVASEPRGYDAITMHTLVNAASDRLHFGEFWHSSIVGERKPDSR